MRFQCFNRISFRREYDGTANWQLSDHLAFVVTGLIFVSGLARVRVRSNGVMLIVRRVDSYGQV